MTVEKAVEELYALQKKLTAYYHAIGLMQYDGATAAPKGTAENRGASMAVLSEEVYRLSTGEDTVSLLEFLDENKDRLGKKEQRMVYLLLKDLREKKRIPIEEYVAFQELIVESDAVWHEAKLKSDFEMFRPYLEKVFETTKKFALYAEPDRDPYEHCLSQYEEGLTVETLDAFFKKLKEAIVPLIARINGVKQVDDSARFGDFALDKQEALSYFLMETIGLDLNHVGLAETEHPFTTHLGTHFDERITTHYFKDDFVCSMYSVVHEGGHALYETGVDDSLAFTVLDGGTAMSIHESQSRFYENIVGRSREFCEYIFPKLCELFPNEMKSRSAEDLYIAVNKAEPSLIRTEADELTYSLHVMIRYELEKRIFSGKLEVKDLPKEWNRLYKEYLGIDVPDDRRGVLQDSHWSGGLIGYFPSYALGNAYGAQFLSEMKKSVDVPGDVRCGNFRAINEWNRERIWKHGRLYTPEEIIESAAGGSFNPDYYIEYLKNKCRDIYGV